VLRERGARHHNAEAGALVSGGEERVPIRSSTSGGIPRPEVAHRNAGRELDLVDLDLDLASFGGRFDSVADQVEEASFSRRGSPR